MRRRYPLEVLRGVRQRAVDQRAVALGQQSQKTELAAGNRRRAQQARVAEEHRTRGVAELERERLEQGVLTAADLSRAADFARGAARRIAERSAAEKAARDRELREQAEERRVRVALARADAESQALERHRDRWERDSQRDRDRATEDEALDHWNARARAKPGST